MARVYKTGAPGPVFIAECTGCGSLFEINRSVAFVLANMGSRMRECPGCKMPGRLVYKNMKVTLVVDDPIQEREKVAQKYDLASINEALKERDSVHGINRMLMLYRTGEADTNWPDWPDETEMRKKKS